MLNNLYVHKFLYVVLFTQSCLIINSVRAQNTTSQPNETATSPQTLTTSQKPVTTSLSQDQRANEATTLGAKTTTKKSSAEKLSEGFYCYTCNTTDTDSPCATAENIHSVKDAEIVLTDCRSGQCWTRHHENITHKVFVVERGCFDAECNDLNTAGPYCATVENATTCHHCCGSNACNNLDSNEAWHCVHGYPTWIATLLSLLNLVVPVIN